MNCHTQDQLTVIVDSIWVSSWLPVLRVTRYHVVNFMMEKATWQDYAASQTKENKDPNTTHTHTSECGNAFFSCWVFVCLQYWPPFECSFSRTHWTKAKPYSKCEGMNVLFINFFVCLLCMHVCVEVSQHTCEDQRTICWELVPSAVLQYILERGNKYHKCGK